MQIFTRKGSATDSEVLQALELEARSSLDTFRGGSRMGDEQALVGEGWSREVSNSEVVVFVGGVWIKQNPSLSRGFLFILSIY